MTITKMIASDWRMSLKGWLRKGDWPNTLRAIRGVGRTLQRKNNLLRFFFWKHGRGKCKDVSRGKEGRKGKHKYIATIPRGTPRTSNSSKRTVKRKIVELMNVSKKEGNNSTKCQKRKILIFRDNEKTRGIPTEIFSLVITATIANFDASRVHIDGGISCDIMYSYIFEKMGLNKERLSPYKGSDLQAFDDTVTCHWECIELMVTYGEGWDTRMIDS